MSSKKLLVEGEADRDFFTACCRVAGIGDPIDIAPPKQFGAGGYGKGNALKILPDLLKRVDVGEITQLGLVIDADFQSTDNGFDKAFGTVQRILQDWGYDISSATNGFIFKHPDKLPDFGLWIMPDNASDGLIEDFIKQSVIASDLPLFNRAAMAVSALPEPKFKPIRASKAEVATWMAWQEKPGQPLAGAVGQNLIDFDNGLPKLFIEWLRQVYQ